MKAPDSPTSNDCNLGAPTGLNTRALTQDIQTFSIGQEVIYGLHGKYTITNIEEKIIDDGRLLFYRLEPKKHHMMKPSRTTILVPLHLAHIQGLRLMSDEPHAQEVFRILASEDLYLDLATSWQDTAHFLEHSIKTEGILGLAKALNHLYTLKRQVPSLPSEVNKFEQQVFKLLSRELAEVLSQPIKKTEERIKHHLTTKAKPRA